MHERLRRGTGGDNRTRGDPGRDARRGRADPRLIAATLLVAGPAAAADLEYGRYLAAECVTCHQSSGAAEGIPSIVGWPEVAFVAVMEAYKSGERNHDVMRTIASRYDPQAMSALAAYFASLDPASGG